MHTHTYIYMGHSIRPVPSHVVSGGGVLFEQGDFVVMQVGDKLDYMSGSVQMFSCHRVQDTLHPYLLKLQRIPHIRQSYKRTGDIDIK